jgi:3-deoxy-D-manno-octulosonic-acid transferase
LRGTSDANIKFDDLPSKTEFGLRDFGFNGHESLWIAGSTHPGEEEIVLRIFQSILKGFSNLRLVIAPRHIERSQEIARLIEEFDLKPARLSELHIGPPDRRSVVIVDTIGHLRSLYSLSKIVFIGKSLAVGGGHNIIEPAFFANAILVGPHMQNFQDIVEIFLKHHALIQVQTAEELSAKMRELLKKPEEIEKIGRNAQEVIQKYRGATEKTLDIIGELLAQEGLS